MIEFSIIDSDDDKLSVLELHDRDTEHVVSISNHGSGQVYLTQSDVSRLVEELCRYLPQPKIILPETKLDQGGIIPQPMIYNL